MPLWCLGSWFSFNTCNLIYYPHNLKMFALFQAPLGGIYAILPQCKWPWPFISADSCRSGMSSRMTLNALWCLYTLVSMEWNWQRDKSSSLLLFFQYSALLPFTFGQSIILIIAIINMGSVGENFSECSVLVILCLRTRTPNTPECYVLTGRQNYHPVKNN